MKVLIVDTHILFRQGLVALLANQTGITIVGEAGTAKEAIEQVVKLEPDLVLMDLGQSNGDNLDTLKNIYALRPQTKVVILTIQENDDLLFSGLRYGVKGYLLKNTSFSKLVASIKALDRGEVAFSRTATRRIVDEFARLSTVNGHAEDKLKSLTSRELEVLRHLAKDSRNQEIADHLSISVSTVKIHIHHILKKLQLRTRGEAVGFARRMQL